MTLTDLLFSQEFLMNAPDMFYDIFPVIVLFGTLAVLLVLGAVVFLLASIRDDYVENNELAQRVLGNIEVEYNQIQSKYTFIKQNADLYARVKKKNENGLLTIDRQSILEIFNQYKTQYNLTNLRLSVSPITDINQPQLQKPSHKVASSDVSIQLEALTDERVYKMLDSMFDDLSGMPRINSISLIRDKPINAEVLNTLRQKGYYPLIRGNIQFKWYSINPIEAPDSLGVVPNAGR